MLRALGLAVIGLITVPALAKPIESENLLPGDPSWELDNPAFHREIEGYASATSVQAGQQLKFYISSNDPQATISIYRVGWYHGVGGRKVYGPVTLATRLQNQPSSGDASGYLDAGWSATTSIRVPLFLPGTAKAWATGFYVAKVTGTTNGFQTYIPFVVRDPNRASDLLFTSGVMTYAAYNFWGGDSFYSEDRAKRISFNRPYDRSYGAGDFLNWEVQMVRFLEREGYDVSYETDIDLHHGLNAAAPHKALLFVGHDEYWTYEMRANVEAALRRGQSMGNFGANTCYWQARLEPDANGNPDRTVVCYKYDAADQDPYAKMSGSWYQSRVTTTWRDPILGRPEGKVFGTQYIGDPFYGDIVVANTGHWAFKGTGLTNGQVLPGLLGYEVDAVDPLAAPSTVTILGSSPCTWGNSNMAVYTTPQGGTVFSTGSMQWTWGLDDYPTAWLWPAPNYVSPAAQQITRNVLYKLITKRNP